jgi:hypothetical protein
MAVQDIKQFQESITKELIETKDRVQFLVGDANWAEVGRYKEAILRKTISQYLPSNLNIGTGFILKNNDHLLGLEPGISTQQDIIIYDGSYPVIFKDGDFVILTESAVRGVIEVKSNVRNYSKAKKPAADALNHILEKFEKLREFETFIPSENTNQIKKFVGLFSYSYDDKKFDDKNIGEALKTSNGLVNHICLGPHKFVRYWENARDLHPNPYKGRCYIKYGLENLSFSYFISNLLHMVSDRNPIDRHWFSFPIPGTKETYRWGDENNSIIKLL